MKKIFLFIIIFLGSCTTPIGGAKKIEDIKPQETPLIETIEAGLWMQMNNYEEKLKTSGSRLKDKDLEKYLKNILCNLSPDYCKDIRVYVQDIPYFNAFMAPNGMMVVWTGLLLRAQNEAQVAAVIGHEAGHYIKRHSLKSWLDAKSRTDLMVLLSIGLAVGGVPAGGDIFNLTQLLQVGFMAKHSRDNEREADKIGLDFLINSGYDPYEAPKIWENIIKEMELGEVNKPLSFLASHPAPEERIKNLKKQIEELKVLKEAEEKEIAVAIPEWYLMPPQGSDMLMYVRGSAVSDQLQLALDLATNSALKNLGKKVITRLASKSQECIRQAGIGEDQVSKTEINLISSTVVDEITVSGYEPIETKLVSLDNGSYRAFILLKYPVAKAYKTFIEKMEKSPKMKGRLTEIKGTDIYKELEKAVAQYSGS